MVKPILLIENYDLISAHIGRDGQIKDKRPAVFVPNTNCCVEFYQNPPRLKYVPNGTENVHVKPHNDSVRLVLMSFVYFGYAEVYLSGTNGQEYLGQIKVVWDAETVSQKEYEDVIEQRASAARLIVSVQEENYRKMISEAALAILGNIQKIAEALIEQNPKKARRFVSGRNVYDLCEIYAHVTEYRLLHASYKYFALYEVHHRNPYFTKQLKAYMGDVIAQRYAKKRERLLCEK